VFEKKVAEKQEEFWIETLFAPRPHRYAKRCGLVLGGFA
jgi:hypothetical protein